MRRAIPVLLLSAAGFVVVWQYEPAQGASTAVAGPGVTAGSAPSISADGASKTVSGSAENTRWGPVQVQASFSNGRITDVRMLQAPDDGPTNRAVPILIEETLRAQSAKVDSVSGATMTSGAYVRSLQSAIDAQGE